MNRKLLRYLTCLLVFALSFSAVGALAETIVVNGRMREAQGTNLESKETTRVVLIRHEHAVTVGQRFEVTGKVYFRGVKDEITYSVKNAAGEKDQSVVAYTGTGLFFKAVKPGVAYVSLVSGSARDTMEVTVLPKVESVTLSASSLSLKAGETESLGATVLPADAEQRLTWSSSNAAVASVNVSGIITARKAGKAKITAKAQNGKTASVVVKVEKQAKAPVRYRALTLGVGLDSMDKQLFPADAREFANMLRLNTFSGARIQVKHVANPSSKKAALAAVKAAFKGSTETDVNYLYISAHGSQPNADGYYLALSSNKNQPVSAQELRALLDGIPGTMVLIVESCYAGDLVNKQAQSGQGFIRAFTAGGKVTKSGEMLGEKYKILCASSKTQMSWTVYREWALKNGFSLSGGAIARGAGWDYLDQPESRPHKTELLADRNADGQVTLAEIYAYAEPVVKEYYGKYNIAKDDTPGAQPTQLCVWPENDDFVVFARN